MNSNEHYLKRYGKAILCYASEAANKRYTKGKWVPFCRNGSKCSHLRTLLCIWWFNEEWYTAPLPVIEDHFAHSLHVRFSTLEQHRNDLCLHSQGQMYPLHITSKEIGDLNSPCIMWDFTQKLPTHPELHRGVEIQCCNLAHL